MANFYKKRTLAYIRDNWGKENTVQNVSFPDTEKFFVHMMKDDDWILDDQTWNDLDMNQNYQKMNRTCSMPGQQCLYNMLRTLRFDEEELSRRGRVMDFLRLNQEQREKLQCVLTYLGKEEYDGAAALLYLKKPPQPKASSWVMPGTVLMILSLISIPFLRWQSLILIAFCFIMNMIIHNQMYQQTQAAMPGIRYLARMLLAAQEIARLNYPQLKEYNEFFDKVVDKCQPFLRKTRRMGFSGVQDPFGLTIYLDILFLTEARAYLRCIGLLDELGPSLRVLYRRLGELDAFCSMVSVRRALRHCCKPEFSSKDLYFSASQLGYPLLPGAVCNDVTLDGRSMVLTGSNMSGKSTFLRTVGLNVILAQTFDMVFAKKYEASFFRVITSISPSDSLAEGNSYYMAEAKAILRMVDFVNTLEGSSLLLIDEIFRGTNPTERVAAAASLLKYFQGKECLVIVATHDSEITRLVEEDYDAYHFEELVTSSSLEFDYKLKQGQLKKPNGIHILEYLGYPEQITEQALKLVAEKEQDGAHDGGL